MTNLQYNYYAYATYDFEGRQIMMLSSVYERDCEWVNEELL